MVAIIVTKAYTENTKFYIHGKYRSCLEKIYYVIYSILGKSNYLYIAKRFTPSRQLSMGQYIISYCTKYTHLPQ